MTDRLLRWKNELIETADLNGAKNLVSTVASGLSGFANQVWCMGMPGIGKSRRAFGAVSLMGGELLTAAKTLFEAQFYYAGSSLVRQLIEVDYLLYLFSVDPEEAARWFEANDKEAKKLFTPNAMRVRSLGRFDSAEYSHHCQIGGHPRRAAFEAIDRLHAFHTDVSPLLWTDLANHSVSVWDNYMRAAVTCSPTNVYPKPWAKITTACEIWLESSVEHRRLAGNPPA